MGIRKKIGSLLIRLSYGLIVVSIGLEVVVRLSGIAPNPPHDYSRFTPDIHLPYRMQPFSVVSGRKDEFSYRYEHNSLGFRDNEHTLEKPAGTFRILALGDSFTYGASATLEETYPKRIERLLTDYYAGSPYFEVINAGIPGYFPESERLLLQHYGLKYQPDLVLVGFLPNDVIDTSMGLKSISVAPDGFLRTGEASEIGPIWTWLYLNSHVCRIVVKKYITYLRQQSQKEVSWDDVYRKNGRHEKDWLKIAHEFEIIVELAHEHGAKTIIIYIPQKNFWLPEAMRAYAAERLSLIVREVGALFVDTRNILRNALQEDNSSKIYWQKDGHLTPLGYDLVARAVVEKILGEQIIEKNIIEASHAHSGDS